MNKIASLLGVILFTSSFCISQDENSTEESKTPVPDSENKRHEINVGFTNLFNRNSFLEDILYLEYYDWGYNSPDGYYYPFFFEGIGINSTRYGIGYKFHFMKSAIRSYFDFGVNNNSNSSTSNGGSITYPTQSKREYSWKSTLLTGRIGYEFIITNKRTDFYFGLDFIFQSSQWKYDYTRETNSFNNTWSSYEKYTSNIKANYSAYGGSPIIGLRYHLTDMISISTETRIDITAFNQKGNSESSTFSSTNFSNSNDDFSSSGLRTKVTPLGLFSLNVHL